MLPHTFLKPSLAVITMLARCGSLAVRCRSNSWSCWSSTMSERLKVDPSTLVVGVTKERIDADEQLAEYMLSNFPDAFASDDSSSDAAAEEISTRFLFLDPAEEKASLAYDEKIRLKKERAKREKEMVYERNIRPLVSILRNPTREDGTRNCKRLRYNEGMIPGLLYGGDPKLEIYSHQDSSKTFLKTPQPLLQRELDRYRRKAFEGRVYNLTVKENLEDDEGTVHVVTPQDVQWHPLLETMYCCNFVRYHPLRPLKIPIRYINEEESPALKREGFMIPIQRTVEVYVEEGADIPESIDLECTGLLMKQVVRKDRLIIPDGVRLSHKVLTHKDYIVGVIQGGSRDDPEEEAATEEKKPTEPEKAKPATGKS